MFELLFTYIQLSSAGMTILFKHKSLNFVNLSLFLYDVSIVGTSSYFSQTSEASLEVALTLVQNWHLLLESFWKSIPDV